MCTWRHPGQFLAQSAAAVFRSGEVVELGFFDRWAAWFLPAAKPRRSIDGKFRSAKHLGNGIVSGFVLAATSA